MQIETLLAQGRYDECFELVPDLLEQGHGAHALHLLEIIRQAAIDCDEMQSKCTYNIGHFLVQMGKDQAGYEILTQLDRKQPKNQWDWSAVCRMAGLFDKHALRLAPPRFPPKVQIELTNRCNLNCLMCPRRQMTREPRDMDLALFERLMDEISREGGTGAALFFLGEPLVHPRFEEMIAIAAAAAERSPIDLRFGIQTNGLLLVPELGRRLLEMGLSDIGISVDAPNDQPGPVHVGGHERIARKNAIALVQNARALDINTQTIGVSTIMADPHGPEAQRFLDDWSEVGCTIMVKPFTPVAEGAYLDPTGQPRQIAEDQVAPRRAYCGSGQRLLVLSNGTYAFCCADYDGNLGLGHANDMTLLEVWHSPRMQQIRQQILTADYTNLPPCQRCYTWNHQTPD